MSKLKFELRLNLDMECDCTVSEWLEICGYNEDNPDDCPVLIRADSYEELKELVCSTLEPLKDNGLSGLPIKTVLVGDNWKIQQDE